MKLTKTDHKRTRYFIDETQLLLTTSVAFYRATLFPIYLRWKVQDDADSIKSLFETPTPESLKALLLYEQLYREMVDGQASKGSEKVKKRVRNEFDAAQRDLYTKNFSVELSDTVLESNAKTIGDLVESNRQKNARNRNSWRNKK